MSIYASGWAWRQKCPDPGTKLVLIKLAEIGLLTIGHRATPSGRLLNVYRLGIATEQRTNR